jgi:alpha-L-rhamnosidase
MFKNATPIWAKDYVDEKNILLEFSCNVNFNGKSSKIRIAADALYRLYVNGKMVSHGPQRAGKGFWRMDQIDLTAALKRGEENTVTVQVVRYGVFSFEYVLQPSFLMAEIEVDNNVVKATGLDGDFAVRRVLSKEQLVERYSYQRPFIEVWNLPNTFSNALELVAVENVKVMPRTAPYPVYNEIDFSLSIAHGKVNIPKVEYHKNLRHPMLGHPNFSYEDEELPVIYRDILFDMNTVEINRDAKEVKDYSFTLENNGFESFKLPYENTGFVKCTLECKEDSTVYFIYDEILCEDDVLPLKHYSGCSNVIPVYAKEGKYDFISIEPRTMQYLKVVCLKGAVKISDIKLVEYVNSMGNVASFKCDDDALNRIYSAAVHTFEQNAVDIFMDCPSRERAGWLCDSFFTGRVEKDLTGGSNVERGFLENFFLATDFGTVSDGMFPMCYPSDEIKGQFIPNWAMFLVVELEEYVQRTGDTRMIDIAKERLYQLEEYFKGYLNEDGLLEKLKGWIFVEWSQANKWVQDVNFPSNMMYYAMLKSMARMYNDSALEQKAEGIKNTIRKLSFNGKFFRDHQVYNENGEKVTPEDITEVCQYYAFFTGIADKENYPELLEIIARDFGAGHKCEKTQPGVFPANAFIGNYLRMDVLSFNGFRKQIINEIKEYFDYMAKLTGTLWENDSTGASCNHGFASHVVRFIFRDCLGVDGVDEVSKKVYLNDDFNAPANAQATIPLNNGSIKITVENGKRNVEIIGDYKIG